MAFVIPFHKIVTFDVILKLFTHASSYLRKKEACNYNGLLYGRNFVLFWYYYVT